MQPVIIKRERVALGAPPPRPERNAQAASCSSTPAKPSLRAVEQDGVVVALELTCSCGEVSLVELRYPADPEARP